MPQFDTLTFSSQIFWLIITFGLLYIIIKNFVVPKAEQIFNNRKNTIDNQLEEATLLNAETEKLKEAYNNEVKNIVDISEEIKKASLLSFNLIFSEKKRELELEIESYNIKAKEEIEEAIKSFRFEEPIVCINIAETIIEKITAKEPDQVLLKESYLKEK